MTSQVRIFAGTHTATMEKEINAFLTSLTKTIITDIKWEMVMDPNIGGFYTALVWYTPR